MNTALEPDISTNRSIGESPADHIRHSFAACRLKFNWLGISKSLTADQKSRAAESFGADGDSISAGKRLIDTSHEAYRALTSLKTQVTRFWKDNSLPYPVSGIRLIRQGRIEEFNAAFQDFQEQLEAGVRVLNNHYPEIKEVAQNRLGSLFNPDDYPDSLTDAFRLEWDFPSVEPPEYLRQLNPELYAEQARRVSRRFDRAVELAEQAFIEELEQLVAHLADRLSGTDDGKPKIFRDSAVSNLTGFFRRFRDLNVNSNEQLDQLVERCEQVMHGVNPQGLRDNDSLRQNLTAQMSGIQASLDQLITERPRRRILRRSRNGNDA